MRDMNAPAVWQVTGAAFELGGLALVAMGIVEARHFAPELLGLVGNVRTKARVMLAKLSWKRQSATVTVGGVAAIASVGRMSARGTVRLGPWDDTPIEERVLDLRRMIEEHADDLDELHGRQGAEEKARITADTEQQNRHVALQQLVEDKIKKATTSGLRRQAWGVLFFAVGIVLGTIGNVLG